MNDDHFQSAVEILVKQGGKRSAAERRVKSLIGSVESVFRAQAQAIPGKKRDDEHEKIARQAKKLRESLRNASPYVISEQGFAGMETCLEKNISGLPDWKPVIDLLSALEQSARKAQQPRQNKPKNGDRSAAVLCLSTYMGTTGVRPAKYSDGPFARFVEHVCASAGQAPKRRERYISEAIDSLADRLAAKT